MNKERFAQPGQALRVLFWGFSALCLLAALLSPDRGDMVPGLVRICTQSGQTVKSYFDISYGGVAGTFLNVGLVGLMASALYSLPGSKVDGVSVLAFFLTAGFSFWGITALSMLLVLPGAGLYCLLEKTPLGAHANFVLFATGLAPLLTDLLFRYPGVEWKGFTWQGLLWAVGVGAFIALVLPAGVKEAGKVTRGYSLYGAAVPLGIVAFFLYSLLYQVLGGALPNGEDFPQHGSVGVGDAFVLEAHVFCVAVFAGAILLGLFAGGSFRKLGELLRDSGHNVDYADKYGAGTALISLGIYGLAVVVMYDVIGAVWNAATLGCVFCMVCCGVKGSHLRNVLPIALGYGAASLAAVWTCESLGTSFALPMNAQAIVIGLCFANGLSPIAGKYGFLAGVLAGAMHYIFVTCVPNLHGGFCLYNGGFTCMFVCVLLVPVLEHHQMEKEKRTMEQAGSRS